MIKVGIDASRIRQGMTGVGRYAAGMLPALDAAMPEAQFVLYTRDTFTEDLPSARWRVVVDTHPLWRRVPVTWWMHYRLGALVNRNPVDVFWSPNTFLPKGARVPCVLTVHDFNHVFVPETLPPLTCFAYRKWMNADILAADANVANSHGTAQRMHELLGRWPDAVAFPAVSAKPVVVSDEAVSRLRQAGIRQPYLLTVGTRAPRKNLASAVAAMAQLRSAGQLLDCQLVMAGPDAWNRGGRKLERGREWIKPLGFVDDDVLSALYAHAEALVFPSLYEGFGMPVIEARAHGCRVVTTDSIELREAGGLDATYTDTSPNAIAAGICKALAEPRPLPQQVQYTWDNSANVMASVLREIAIIQKVPERSSSHLMGV